MGSGICYNIFNPRTGARKGRCRCMKYDQELHCHYKPKKGWVNDPNGLVYFNGFYHVFYQHAPDYEVPWKQPMHWGHARTKNFLDWEELPIALCPDKEYDANGCWSGTAIVRDRMLYLFYASIRDKQQTVSVAYSEDGIHFEKYEKNPIIASAPSDGGPDFRDPAVCCIDGKYYCVMASGNPEHRAGRLLLYKSDNLFDWEYRGILAEWENCKYTECPSFMPAENGLYLLSASVNPLEQKHYFSVMYGTFANDSFHALYTAEVDKGPDQYAGQIFRDDRGRNILISWLPGWKYSGYTEKDVGCMSVPREFRLNNGEITAEPVEELRHLLKDKDECLERTPNGFVVKRTNREPLVYEGDIQELKIIRDEYLAEIFVNGGKEIYSVLL